MEDKKIALLIDADNISPRYIKTIVEDAAKEGSITYKRIYGDWTSPNLSSWKQELLDYSLNPVQQYAYTTGKNATDSAMIIDAMDILYTRTVDGFCLVSSDSDFTKLAARLKESGMLVIGMGKEQTPKPFVVACSKFKYLDIIAGDSSKSITDSAENSENENSALTTVNALKESINQIIDENSDAEGWTLASKIGSLLLNQYSDFDCRNYGCKKMIELLKKLGYTTRVSEDKKVYKIRK